MSGFHGVLAAMFFAVFADNFCLVVDRFSFCLLGFVIYWVRCQSYDGSQLSLG